LLAEGSEILLWIISKINRLSDFLLKTEQSYFLFNLGHEQREIHNLSAVSDQQLPLCASTQKARRYESGSMIAPPRIIIITPIAPINCNSRMKLGFALFRLNMEQTQEARLEMRPSALRPSPKKCAVVAGECAREIKQQQQSVSAC